jgi:hypothetical protein
MIKYPSEWVHKGKGISLEWLRGHFWPTLNTATCSPKWWNILWSEYTKVKESLWIDLGDIYDQLKTKPHVVLNDEISFDESHSGSLGHMGVSSGSPRPKDTHLGSEGPKERALGLLDPEGQCNAPDTVLGQHSIVWTILLSTSGSPSPKVTHLGSEGPKERALGQLDPEGQCNAPDSVLGQHSIVWTILLSTRESPGPNFFPHVVLNDKISLWVSTQR